MKRYDLITVGGGASGLAAAVEAGRAGMSVAVLERLPRVGKKLLVTGNGRCNISNINFAKHAYHNAGFARHVLTEFDLDSTVKFFCSLGLPLTDDGAGRLYPMSNTAASVLDLLRFEAARRGVEFICDYRVTDIKKVNGLFIINNEYSARAVVIAAGGCAASVHGSDGSGFALLKSMGHKITPVFPSLVQLVTAQGITKQLKGIRVCADISIETNGKETAGSSGEILFTDYGISGIAAMEVSRAASRHFAYNERGACCAVLDLAPKMSAAELKKLITDFTESAPESELAGLLTGVLPKSLAQLVCKHACTLAPSSKISSLTPSDISAIADKVKRFELTVTATKDFAQAQVTAGGADVSQFNSQTLESMLVGGLYACGEVLDVDGGCGGFNLQWAWSSGRTCGALK